ncbi:MFS transporter [Candidatus Daviesbacteria bacterium]|nr:MFS transporter [Candidatus Daviesbacteria bacterium]
MEEKPSMTSVITNPGFLNLWVNQILVQLSFNALNFALIIWVFKLTDSNIAVAMLMVAISLPAVLWGLFAGVIVDIIDRKKIIMVIDFALSLLFFSLIFLKGNLLALLGITFLINTAAQLYSPAEASAIPVIVKRKQLLSANSVFSATLYSCFLLGFGLAGPLISHLGINFIFVLGGVLLGIAFLLSLSFPSIKTVAGKEEEKLIKVLSGKHYVKLWSFGISEIKETIRLIRGKLPVLTSIAILAGVQMIIGTMAVLSPGFLEKSLQIKATDASYVLIIPLGLGIVIGGLLLGKFGQGLIRRRLVSRSILLGGLLLFSVGIAPLISPAIRYFHAPRPPLSKVLVAGSFLIGIILVSVLIPSQTVLQENTPEEDRGKVFAVLGVAMAGLSLGPVLLSGLLADLFGTTPIFIGLGSTVILAGLFGLKPSLFFKKEHLSYRVREFLGLGHWEGK